MTDGIQEMDLRETGWELGLGASG